MDDIENNVFNNIIKNNDPSLGNVMYYENIIDAQNQNLTQLLLIIKLLFNLMFYKVRDQWRKTIEP